MIASYCYLRDILLLKILSQLIVGVNKSEKITQKNYTPERIGSVNFY